MYLQRRVENEIAKNGTHNSIALHCGRIVAGGGRMDENRFHHNRNRHRYFQLAQFPLTLTKTVLVEHTFRGAL